MPEACIGHQIKKVLQLEAEVANLKHVNSMQVSIHQEDMESHQAETQCLWQEHAVQLKAKDAFCDAEKVRVLVEL